MLVRLLFEQFDITFIVADSDHIAQVWYKHMQVCVEQKKQR